jgi:hypothetical protein
MVTKTKNKTADAISDVAAKTGLLLMAAATTLGMVEMPNHNKEKIVLPMQASPAFAPALGGSENEVQASQMRREREEAGPHYVSYAVYQRTPSRTGKI